MLTANKTIDFAERAKSKLNGDARLLGLFTVLSDNNKNGAAGAMCFVEAARRFVPAVAASLAEILRVSNEEQMSGFIYKGYEAMLDIAVKKNTIALERLPVVLEQSKFFGLSNDLKKIVDAMCGGRILTTEEYKKISFLDLKNKPQLSGLSVYYKDKRFNHPQGTTCAGGNEYGPFKRVIIDIDGIFNSYDYCEKFKKDHNVLDVPELRCTYTGIDKKPCIIVREYIKSVVEDRGMGEDLLSKVKPCRATHPRFEKNGMIIKN